VALQLNKLGVTRVRPLLGGFEGWQERGFPVEPIEMAATGKPG
jgi:rhodanese-related sulfurtransferase